MPETPASRDNEAAAVKRLGRLISSIVVYTDGVRTETDRTVRDIYDSIGDDVIESQQAWDSQSNRRKVRVRLENLHSRVEPITVKRDAYIARVVQGEYNIAFYEHWFAANYTGFVGKLGNPSKTQRVKRFETPSNKLIDELAMSADREAMLKRLDDSIVRSVTEGRSLRQATRDIDVVLGFRTRDGEITDLGRRRLNNGEKVIKGGEIYRSTRVARTELARMRAWADIDAMKRLQGKGFDERLQKIAVLDDRTRQQSAQMHMDISDQEGRFKYPNGQWYHMGQQPARWAINDRGKAIPHIDPEALKKYGETKGIYQDIDADGNVQDVQATLKPEYRTWAEFARDNDLRVNRYGEVVDPDRI